MSYVPYVVEKTGNGERSYDIFSRLLKDRIVMLNGEINDQVSASIVSQLLFLEAEDPDKDIYMYINSPGGVVTSGMAIYDTMLYIKPDIITVCIGQAASMGSFLLSCGTEGKRYVAPHARVMIHQPLGGARGQATDIQIQAKEIQRMKEELTGILAKNSCNKTSYEDMLIACDRDNFLSAQQAIDMGLADKILIRN